MALPPEDLAGSPSSPDPFGFLDEPYEYKPLLSSKSIRLAQILGQNEHGVVQCSLTDVDLNDRPFYNCLSYSWGDPYPAGSKLPTEQSPHDDTNKWPIECDGKLLWVTQNLYDALQQIPQWRRIPDVEHAMDPNLSRTPLHKAAKMGDVDMICHLLFKGANVRALDCSGKTPLHYAVSSKHHEVVKALVEALAQPQIPKSSDQKAATQQVSSDTATPGRIQQGEEQVWSEISSYLKDLKISDSKDAGVDKKRSSRPGFQQDLIWIDEICINQDDNEERGTQLQLMSEIYESAQVVFAWLGPEDEAN